MEYEIRKRKLENELQRYKVIFEYYLKNKDRLKPNEGYIINIGDRLKEILSREVPRHLEKECLGLYSLFIKIGYF